LLKSKIEKFVAKRVLMFFIILAILNLVFNDERWYLLFGLMFGGIFSTFKFVAYAVVLKKALVIETENGKSRSGTKNSLLTFIISQIILLPVLFLSLKFNQSFFTGIVMGILLVPFVIFINCITELLKITHNNFE
jgi:hypothetical protein